MHVLLSFNSKAVLCNPAFFYGVKPSVYTLICMYLMPTYKTEGMEIITRQGSVIGENALLGLSLVGKRIKDALAFECVPVCGADKANHARQTLPSAATRLQGCIDIRRLRSSLARGAWFKCSVVAFDVKETRVGLDGFARTVRIGGTLQQTV